MHFISLSSVALSLALCQTALSATADDWRSRTIYQVMTDRFARTDGSTTAACDTINQTYCGGTWQGIINNLDYIQGLGFDAVWISPVTFQIPGTSIDGDGYHGYWQSDLYSVNPYFGTSNDLQTLSSALHARDMYLMVDIVVNHNGWIGPPQNVSYSTFHPFNDKSYYHDYCSVNYNNMTSVTDCWMGDTNVPLPDLRTENSNVATGYQTWISQLVSNYSIDGLRIDTVMQVDTAFWQGFASASGVYMVGEVNDAVPSTVCGYQSYLPGVLNYATYFSLISAFESTSGSMSALETAIDATASACTDMSLLGTFSENQDQPRFPSINGDVAPDTNVIAFTMLTDGIPIIYQGQEQHYDGAGQVGVPYNRAALWFSDYDTSAPLYSVIATFNQIRKAAIADDSTFLTTKMSAIATDNSTLAVKKGKLAMVLTNTGYGQANTSYTMTAGYDAGLELTELLTCDTLTADSSGNIFTYMGAGQPKIFYPTASLSQGLCGASTKKKPRSIGSSAKFPKKPTKAMVI